MIISQLDDASALRAAPSTGMISLSRELNQACGRWQGQKNPSRVSSGPFFPAARLPPANSSGSHHQSTPPSSSSSPGSQQSLDFYSILGIPAEAEPPQIRRAYHALMRELHPDVAAGRADTEAAAAAEDLCVLVNEIYVGHTVSSRSLWLLAQVISVICA